MHEWLHVSVLAVTLLAAAGLVALVLWPLVSDRPQGRGAVTIVVGLALLALLLVVLEWRFVH